MMLLLCRTNKNRPCAGSKKPVNITKFFFLGIRQSISDPASDPAEEPKSFLARDLFLFLAESQ